MNYATKIKTAMASVLCVMVGMAFAGTTVTNDVQTYGATFESSTGADNDFAYKAGQKIANYTNELGTAGWFAGSEDDESVISNRTAAVEGLGSQYLLLNTDAETLTNKLDTTVKAGVNTAMAGGARVDASLYDGNVATYEGAVFESDVKFVASDTLDAGIPGGQDATKFAIYAYCNEDADPVTTNLVVFHAVRPKRGAITYTNYVFSSVDIDTTAYTHLKVVMKQVSNADKLYDVFSVTVGSGDNAVTLENEFASEVRFGDAATGNWFFTVEDAADDSKQVSSLNFKGTGEIDNIKVSQKVKEEYAAIVGGIKYASWETATNVAMNTANVLTSYESGKTLHLEAEDFISIANVQPVATNTVAGYKVETIAGDGFLTYTSKLDKATVIFLSDTGVELFRDDFQIGEAAVYGGTLPSKTADASGVYTWTGWTSGGVDYGTSDALATVGVGGATYTATFSSVASQASVNGTYYATLADAISAATGTEYPVVLNDDVALSSTIIITDDVTIDLNDHDIAATGCRAIWVKSGNVLITGEGNVTAEGPGLGATSSVIRVGDGAANANIAALTVNTNVTVASATCYGVTVFGKNNDDNNATTDITFDLYGTVEVSAPYVAHGCDAAISGNGNSGNSAVDITIHDGAVVTSDNANGIYFPSAGTLAIEGGTITGATAVYAKAGNIDISGGTLVATGTKAAYAATGDGANPTGDAIVIDNCGYPSGLSLDVAVTGGDVSSAYGDPIGSFATGSGHEPKDGFVSGGTFDAPLADDLCANGFIPVTEPNGEGKYEVTPGGTVTFKNGDVVLFTTNVVNGGTAVYEGAAPTKAADASGVYTFDGWDPATIAVMNSADQTYTATFSKSGDAKATVITITDAGATTNVVGYYASLADAIRAADDGATVVLLADETADATKTTQADRLVVTKQITIDFGPYTYSVPGSLEPTDNWCALFIDADTVVKGTTGGIDCLDEEDSSDPCGVYAFNVRNNAKLTIEGGVYHGGGTVIQAQLGTVEINGGTFSVTPYDAPYYYDFALNCVDANYKAGNAGFEINGGTFIGFDPQNNTSEGAGTDYTDDGYVAIDDGNGNFVVQAGYNVTFDANGGTPAPEAQRVAAGGTATAPAAPAKAGCTFAGWTLNNAAYNFATVLSADIELVAAYDAAKATVISVAGTVTNYYPTLAAAVAAVPTDGSSYTVGILSDVTLSSKLTVTGGQKVSFQADEPVVVNGQLRILDGSSVTIGENVTFTSTGHPTVYIMGDPAVNVAGTAKSELIVNGVVANTNPDYDATFAIAGNGTDTKGADITIGTSGVVSNLNGIAIYQAFPGDLTVAGKVEGASAITIKDGTLTVQDGAVIIATGSYVAHSTNGNGASPTGDAIQVPYYPASMGYGTPVVSIEGGTITVADASNGAVGVQAYDNNNVVAPEDSESNINVEGGTFNTPVNEAYCAEGYIPEDNGNGTYGVEEGWNIKFVNYNGDELWATNVAKNAAFTYGGETPVKAADASGIYAFDGWDNDIVSPAVADATYTATFSKSGDAKATVITITDAGATTNVVGYYASLADAIHAADDGDTVVLLADETADATKTTQADRLVVTKQITIDFGEHTYSVPGSLEPTDNWCALFIDANTTLKGTTGGINCLDKEGPTDKAGVYAINVRNGATLTIEGGTYHGGGTVVQTQLGSTVINGGTFSVTAYDEPYGTDFALNCVDSAYTADTAGFAINGGTFIGFDPQDSKAEGENTDFTSDGFVAIDDGNGNFMVQAGYNVTFANYDATVLETQRVPAGETPVYGGTTPTKPADAAGVYTFDAWSPAIDAATADVTYTAQFTTATSKATVITITGTTTNTVGYYATLAAAVDAANDGDTVVLLANETISGRILVTDSITIDLGGNNVTRTAAPASDNGSAFRVDGSVTVTIKNGGIDVSGVDDTSVLTDGVWAIDAKNGANLTLADLNVVVDSRNGGCVYAWNTAHITINSGDYSNVTDEPYDHHAGWQGMAVNQANVATKLLTINGGSFSQQDPQLGDDSQTGTASASADFTSDGYVAIVEGGKFVVQEGYNVTFDANGGTPAPEAQRVAQGGKATAPTAPTKEHYDFAGWTLNNAAYNFDTVLTGDITLVASYTLQSHILTINYASEDAGFTAPATFTSNIVYGAAYSVASPEVAGFELVNAAQATITGTMGDEDVSVTVTYQKVAASAITFPDSDEEIPAGALLSWIEAQGFDQAAVNAAGTTAKLNECYLLNCTPGASNGGTITVSAINVGADVKVTVTLARTGAIDQAINGTLYLYGATSLTSGFSKIDEGVTIGSNHFAAGDSTVITFTGTAQKFFKAVIK